MILIFQACFSSFRKLYLFNFELMSVTIEIFGLLLSKIFDLRFSCNSSLCKRGKFHYFKLSQAKQAVTIWVKSKYCNLTRLIKIKHMKIIIL